MEQDNPVFRPTNDLQVSKLRFYSFGLVAENKALSSNVIEVTPMEELTMLDGEINATQTTQEASGKDIDGQSYTSKVATSNTMQADWLRMGSSNRMTAPDVRRGAVVAIYQFADADKYYWNTLKNDSDLRKLETVIWAFSATKNESSKTDANNSYYFEVSTHTKRIVVHTSTANEEKYSYDLVVDAANGFISFKDSNNNEIKLDSVAEHLFMLNNTGTYMEIIKGIANIKSPESINFESPVGTWKADHITITCPELVFTE